MNITIEDKEYEVNIEAAKAAGLLKEVKPIIKYKIGQRFKEKNSRSVYILARVDVSSRAAGLINVKTGGIWTCPVIVKNIQDISEEEFKKIIGGDYSENFILLD